MKKIIIFMFITIFTACATTGNHSQNKEVKIEPVKGYDVVHSPVEFYVSIISEEDFNQNLTPKETLFGEPTKINFRKKKVASIVLPESYYYTEIVINKTYISNRVFHVKYSVEKSESRRHLATIPATIFSFNSHIDADYILFDNGVNQTKLSLK